MTYVVDGQVANGFLPGLEEAALKGGAVNVNAMRDAKHVAHGHHGEAAPHLYHVRHQLRLSLFTMHKTLLAEVDSMLAFALQMQMRPMHSCDPFLTSLP